MVAYVVRIFQLSEEFLALGTVRRHSTRTHRRLDFHKPSPDFAIQAFPTHCGRPTGLARPDTANARLDRHTPPARGRDISAADRQNGDGGGTLEESPSVHQAMIRVVFARINQPSAAFVEKCPSRQRLPTKFSAPLTFATAFSWLTRLKVKSATSPWR